MVRRQQLGPGFRLTFILLFLSVATFAAGSARAMDITIGVLAKRGVEKVLEQWRPTADYLTEAVPGHRFRIVPVLFDEVSLVVRNKLVDFVVMNSAIYVELSVRYGVQRILTLRNRLGPGQVTSRFGSVLLANKSNSDIRNYRDLSGRRVAAVHMTSLGGWIMALRELREAGLDRDDFSDLKFLDTHDAVVEAVADGRAEVGIVRTDTLERMAAEGRVDADSFHVVAPRSFADYPFRVSTRLYPEWPIAKLAHTPRELAKIVAQALMAMDRSDPAAEAARITGWTIPENYQPVHEILQELQLAPYEWFGEISPAAALRSYWPWLVGVVMVLILQTFLVVRIMALNKTLRRHQKALEDTERQYRSTFDQAPVGVAHLSPDGDLVRVNNAFSALTGYSAAELGGLNYNHLPHAEELASSLVKLNDLRDGLVDRIDLRQRWINKAQETIGVHLVATAVREDGDRVRFLILVATPSGPGFSEWAEGGS
ncbi:phosphate/phosphite/phosphonate ABC transporter substrate-binding protein [Magnetospira sp. QH-2]|uniref:phosphate/phosphite/phosphonate ABC transporter substrate-binding protein n=1 Tax=Magnetospira sp. (strain QH-2) TaxID=1288970 RepID=UPI00130ECAFA|nr:phosphate/phosphite/phosphonate ABC transporter substrate-binding protein [Magnetospira sp. QH-2]